MNKPTIIFTMVSGQKIYVEMTENLEDIKNPQKSLETKKEFCSTFFSLKWVEFDNLGRKITIVPSNVETIEFVV